MICKNNNKCKTGLKILTSSFLVFLLIIKINWVEVWGHISNANIYLIVWYIMFYVLGLIVSARKWQVLARFKQFKNNFLFYFKSYLLGTFLNNFFPSFIGGDTYRVYSLGKPVQKVSESSTTVVVDRISGLVGIMILSVAFAWMNYEVLISHQIIVWIIITLIVLLICIFAGVLFFGSKFVQYFVKFLPQSIQRYIKQIFAFRHPAIASKALGYSFLFAIVGVAIANYLLFKSIGVCLSVEDYISVIFLSSIIASVPISVGNIGVKEWAYVFLFGIFGVTSNAAVTVVLLSRVLQILVSLIAVPFYLQNKNKLEYKK